MRNELRKSYTMSVTERCNYMKKIFILLLSLILCTVPCLAVEESSEGVTEATEVTTEATTKKAEEATEKAEKTTKKAEKTTKKAKTTKKTEKAEPDVEEDREEEPEKHVHYRRFGKSNKRISQYKT